jgi:hypothetical protein
MTHNAQNHYECISLYGIVVAPKALNTTINSSSWATKKHNMSSGCDFFEHRSGGAHQKVPLKVVFLT